MRGNQGSALILHGMSSYLRRRMTMFLPVTFIDSRQRGKITLTLELFPDFQYESLEDSTVLAMLRAGLRLFLSWHCSHVIFDEAQHIPELFFCLQSVIDESNKLSIAEAVDIDRKTAVKWMLVLETSFLRCLV